jgi:tetratricopeptide (TPR) repeat protein
LKHFGWIAAPVAGLLLLCGTPASASDTDASAQARADLPRLEAAFGASPDDPDLAWAVATTAVAAGETDAPERLAAFIARWPSLRPDAQIVLGQALAARGRDAEALRAFDRAVLASPKSGPAWLHRGLTLRRLGRLEEAEAAFARAAELAPELAAETLLLRGLDRRARGEQDASETLLRAAIDVDPSGEAARRARLVLGESTLGAPEPWLSLLAEGGLEWDSNVTLDGRLQLPDREDPQDVRSVFASGFAIRPIRGERVGMSLGYRYDGSIHSDLHDYDLGNHLAFGSFLVRPHPRVTLRLDGLFDHARLGDARYGETRTVRPNVYLGFGEELGVLRLYGDLEERSYYDEPALDSFDRDGRAYGFGLEHSVVVPGWREAVFTFGGRYSKFDARAGDDILGFDGAYDNRRWEGLLRLEAPLFWKIRATSSVVLGRERYDNPNIVDALTHDGVGTVYPVRRHDWVTQASLSFVRPVTDYAAIELGWRGTFRDSNVDLYAYDEHVVGLRLRVQTR